MRILHLMPLGSCFVRSRAAVQTPRTLHLMAQIRLRDVSYRAHLYASAFIMYL